MKRYTIYVMVYTVCLFVLSSETVQAESFSSNMKNAAKYYEEGEYDKAIESYDGALLERPNDPIARYNRAVMLYKKEDFVEAEKAFLDALAYGDEKTEELAVYNTGNSQYSATASLSETDKEAAKAGYEKALEYYKRAMEISPDDLDAKYNYEITTKKILEMEQQEQQQQQQQQQDKNEDKEDKEQQDRQQTSDSRQQQEQEKKEDQEKEEEKQQQEQEKKEDQEKEEEQDRQQTSDNRQQQEQEKEQQKKEEQEKREKQKQEQQKKDKQQASDSRQQAEQQKEDEMSKEEAEMLLRAQQEEEDRLRAEQKKARKERRPMVLRDW